MPDVENVDGTVWRVGWREGGRGGGGGEKGMEREREREGEGQSILAADRTLEIDDCPACGVERGRGERWKEGEREKREGEREKG